MIVKGTCFELFQDTVLVTAVWLLTLRKEDFQNRFGKYQDWQDKYVRNKGALRELNGNVSFTVISF